MWKKRLALILGIIGAAAGGLNPFINKTTTEGSSDVLIGNVVGGIVLGGAIWFAIGMGIGALIDRSKRSRTAELPTTGNYSPRAQPTATPTTPGWFGDPHQRFQTRYFDGSAWTNHVATNGRQYVDEPTP